MKKENMLFVTVYIHVITLLDMISLTFYYNYDT